MPVQPIQVNVAGQITGATDSGPITPALLAFELVLQNAHLQTTVTVEPADVLKPVALPASQGPPGAVQNFFLLQTNHKVTVQLNGTAALTFTLAGPKHFLAFSTTPEVTSIQLTGVSAQRATVSILKVVGPVIPDA